MKKLLLVSALLVMSQLAFSAKVGAVPGAKSKLLEGRFNDYDFQSEESLKGNGITGYVQVGVDTVTFSNTHKDTNQAYPYTKFETFISPDSNIYLDGKVAYRFDYNKPHEQSMKVNKQGKENGQINYAQTNALYTDFNIGSFYRNGNFFLNYKVGFSNFNFQNSKVRSRTEIRFVPKASYKFNDKLSWYAKGYAGFLSADEDKLTAVEWHTTGQNKGEPSRFETNLVKHRDYIHKIETGLTYMATEKLSLTGGIFNKTQEKYAGEYAEWMYLAKADYALYSTENLQLIPYFQYIYTPEIESGLGRPKGGESFNDETGMRLGFKLGYEINPNWALDVDASYYKQNTNKKAGGASEQGGSGALERTARHATIVRLGVKRYF